MLSVSKYLQKGGLIGGNTGLVLKAFKSQSKLCLERGRG